MKASDPELARDGIDVKKASASDGVSPSSSTKRNGPMGH